MEPQDLPGGCGASSPCFSHVMKTHRALLVGGGEGCIWGENGLNLNRNESTVRPMRDMWGTGSQPGARTSLPALLGPELGVWSPRVLPWEIGSCSPAPRGGLCPGRCCYKRPGSRAWVAQALPSHLHGALPAGGACVATSWHPWWLSLRHCLWTMRSLGVSSPANPCLCVSAGSRRRWACCRCGT